MISFSLGNYSTSQLLVTLLVVPVVLIALYAVVRGIRAKSLKTSAVAVVAVIVVIIVIIVFVVPEMGGHSASSNLDIYIGNGFVEFDSSPTGQINVTASQITNVSVVHMDTGLLVMSKEHGLGGGISKTTPHINVGAFRLSNGKTAYVASNNLTNLVIDTTGGYYVVLAPQHNITRFLTDFSKYVYPVAGY